MAFDLAISPHQRGYTRCSVKGRREESRRGGLKTTGRMFLLSSDHSQIVNGAPLAFANALLKVYPPSVRSTVHTYGLVGAGTE